MSSGFSHLLRRTSRFTFRTSRQTRSPICRGISQQHHNQPRFSNTVAYIGGLATLPVVGCVLFYMSQRRVSPDDRFRALPLYVLVNKIKEDLNTASKIQQTPSQLLRRLRSAVKAYVAYIPGAGYLVDNIFDEMAKLHERLDEREKDANTLIALAILDIMTTSHDDAGAWFEIYGICRRLSKYLEKLAKDGDFEVRRICMSGRENAKSSANGQTSDPGDIDKDGEMKETVEGSGEAKDVGSIPT